MNCFLIRRTSPWALAFLAVGLAAASCGHSEPTESNEPAAQKELASPETPQVVYEPAYPAEVSADGLSSEDAAQQNQHSHGEGEEHAHGDDGHGDHGDEEEAHPHEGDDGHDQEHGHDHTDPPGETVHDNSDH